jgi:hypothetical protein
MQMELKSLRECEGSGSILVDFFLMDLALA